MANDIETEAVDLNEPFFCLYLDVSEYNAMTRFEYIEKCSEIISKAKIKCFIIPVENQETKFECVWRGKEIENKEHYDFVYEKLNKIFELIKSKKDQPEIDMIMRNFTLNKILK